MPEQIGFWRQLGDFMGGMVPGSGGIQGMRDIRTKREQGAMAAQQQQAALAALQQKIGKENPTMALMMAVDPQGALKALGTQFEASNLEGGASRQFGRGGGMVTAPKMVMDNGVAGIQTPQGTKWGKPRPVTSVEAANMTNMGADNDLAERKFTAEIEQFAKTHGLDAQQLAETIRHNRAQEGLGWKREGRIGAGGGGGAINPNQVIWD